MLQEPAVGYIDNYYSRTLGADNGYPALNKHETTDVCVIGGGLAGLNTALGLLNRGKSVVLVEAKRIGWGASGRNGGFVAKGYAAGQDTLKARLGLAHARKLVDLTKDGRALIKKRIEDYTIDCGPLKYGVLIVSTKDREENIQQSIKTANDDFELDLEYLSTDQVRAQCKTEFYHQGYLSPHDFQFHPLRYVHGLARVIAEKGGVIHENSPAIEIKQDKGGWCVKTPSGSVTAKDIVYCCSQYAHGLNKKIEGGSFPVQTYVMVTEPMPEEVLNSALATYHPIYDMRWSCDYYRRLPDNRILWGGRVGLWAQPHNIAATMMGDMLNVYPQLKGKVQSSLAWSGLMCYAPHQMPQIGKIAPGYWYNTGFGGHGLVPTTVGGEMIAGAIAENDKSIELFEPFGLRYAGGPLGQYAAQMIYWLWRAKDYIG